MDMSQIMEKAEMFSLDTDNETRIYRFCEILLEEFKEIEVDEFREHFRGMALHKNEKEFILELAFKLNMS